MDPNFQMILIEMKKMDSWIDAKWQEKFQELELRFREAEQKQKARRWRH